MSQTPAGPLPLEGIRVLDIATFIAVPFTAAVLGEFGAEVIKIEQPGGGDPLRRFGTPTEAGDTLVWFSEARNKTSITLDLRRPEGAALFKRLAAVTDIVCENFRPGTLERWGLGWEVLSAINPRLILLRITGYGQTGPYRDRPGFARIAHAFGGLTHLAGMPDGPPVTPGSTSLADYGSGLYGAIGVLLALRSRDLTGRGQIVDIALYDSMFRCLDELAPAFARYGIVRDREGLSTRNACPHGHFPTRDGHWVAIACTSDRIFARFAAVIGRPELAAPDRYGPVGHRLADRAAVDRIVGPRRTAATRSWSGASSARSPDPLDRRDLRGPALRRPRHPEPAAARPADRPRRDAAPVGHAGPHRQPGPRPGRRQPQDLWRAAGAERRGSGGAGGRRGDLIAKRCVGAQGGAQGAWKPPDMVAVAVSGRTMRRGEGHEARL